jgi:programmed cell death protein 5
MTEPTNEQIESAKRMILSRALNKEANERLGRVRLANPMLASQLELYIVQLYTMGQLKQTITDEKLKEILNEIAQKRNIKITRK